MLIVGFTRGILIVMKDGMISDTIVYYLVSLLSGASKYVSAYGMLFLQNIIKFFITGSSSQATITMPIMAPTAELIGLSKQIAVLAYQFGNGFADMFWPTSCALLLRSYGRTAQQMVQIHYAVLRNRACA